MISHPSKKTISDLYLAGKPQVAWTTLIADLETPVSAMLKLADGRSNSFLLESVEGGKVRGRFSIIGMNPDIIWKFKKKIAQINRKARINTNEFETCPEEPLQSLRALVAESRI